MKLTKLVSLDISDETLQDMELKFTPKSNNDGEPKTSLPSLLYENDRILCQVSREDFEIKNQDSTNEKFEKQSEVEKDDPEVVFVSENNSIDK